MTSSLLKARDQKILEAFPKRPMTVLNDRLVPPVAAILLSLLFGGLLIAIVGMEFSDILYDFQVARSYSADTTASVDGSCRRTKAIFINCEASITYRVDPERSVFKNVKHDFMYLGIETPKNAQVVRSNKDNSMLTTDLAIQHLRNRIIVFLIFSVLFGSLTLHYVKLGFKNYGIRKKLKSKIILRPMFGTITKIEGEDEQVIKFTTTSKGRTRYWSNQLHINETPLNVSLNGEKFLVAALYDMSHVMLVDQDFSGLDFSDLEMLELKSAIGC